jgi:hypothetical protein
MHISAHILHCISLAELKVKSSPSNGNSTSKNNGGGGDISDNADNGGSEPGRGGDGSERGRRASGVLLGEGMVKGSVGVVGEGKVSWHKNFCMPGITLCFKVA